MWEAGKCVVAAIATTAEKPGLGSGIPGSIYLPTLGTLRTDMIPMI